MTTLDSQANISVTLTVELLQETLIALVEREALLHTEINATNVVISAISRRQLSRVVGAICGIEDALEGAALKAAAAAAN